ncbi:MAG: hypothetical protein ACI4E1_04410 [Lachnospira sp.]
MHYIFPYFIILVIILQLFIRKNTRKREQREQDFFEKERKANLVRRQDISKLDYIVLSDDIFLLDRPECNEFQSLYNNNPLIQSAYRDLESLKGKNILNLNGISNTDLKLQYGVANLTTLTECDDNYTLLVKSLSIIGHALFEEGYYDYARIFLEYGINIGTDIRSIYSDLATIYLHENSADKISQLIDTASELDSINRDIILNQISSLV